MKMQKWLVGMLVLVLCISLFAGCSTENTGGKTESNTVGNAKEKKVIGVVIGNFSDQFQSYILDGMKEAAKKYEDEYQFVYVDAKFDQNMQLSLVENFISQKVDAIALIPVDREASKPMVEQIVAAGIPLISVNSKLGNQELANSYVGSNSVESGEIEMQAVADKLGGKGNIVVLHGDYGHEAQIDRYQGYKNILEKYPDIKIIAEDTGKWARAEGMQVVENWLQSDLRDKIDAVVAQNDEMAIGALKAIEDAGLLDKIVVAGIDATPEAIEYLKKGKLEITVFQDAKGQGKKAIEVAVKAANGEDVEKEYMIPYQLVNPEEADKYLELYK
jgi:inositol transport system substrate-binding protein